MAERWHFVSDYKLSFLNYLLPFLSISFVLFLEVIPNSFFSGIMPFMGPIVVFYWAFYEPRYFPKTVALLLGFFSDTVFSAFIGPHMVIYFIVRQVAVAQRRYLAMRKFVSLWLAFSVLMVGLFVMQAFYMHTLNFEHDPFVFTKLTQTIFAFPVVYYALAKVHYYLIYKGWL